MKTPQPEKRHLRVSSGSHSPSEIANTIAPYRPFIQQVRPRPQENDLFSFLFLLKDKALLLLL